MKSRKINENFAYVCISKNNLLLKLGVSETVSQTNLPLSGNKSGGKKKRIILISDDRILRKFKLRSKEWRVARHSAPAAIIAFNFSRRTWPGRTGSQSSIYGIFFLIDIRLLSHLHNSPQQRRGSGSFHIFSVDHRQDVSLSSVSEDEHTEPHERGLKRVRKKKTEKHC